MTATPNPPHAPLDDEDADYVRRNYCSLDEVCLGRRETPDEVRNAMRTGQLPRPSYLLAKDEMVPLDYFLMVDAAGGMNFLRECFLQRHRAIALHYADKLAETDSEVEWNGYLSGGFGVCLRAVTPENVFLKDLCMAHISALIEDPKPSAPSWRAALRIWVRRLDCLLRPFAKVDRPRFGGTVSRDRLIAGPRETYPDVFAKPGLL